MATKMKVEVVVITGASAGVGRAVVRAYAKRGAHIGLIARGRAGLEAAYREVEEFGGRGLMLPIDVADANAVETAAARVEAAFGPIDVWINNAMLSVFSPVKEMAPEDFERVTDVTYLGYVHGTMSALKRMLPRDQGVIVQVGSALAYRGIPLQSAYCAAKHAVQGFMDSLYSELLHDESNVKVTMVQLPAVNTPQFRWVKSRLPNEAQPVPPIYQPEVIATGIVYAADHPRRELWIGWPTVKAIAGNKVAPGYGDRYLARHGYSDQQIDQARDIERTHNLWQPMDDAEDHGAHGVFDHRARPFSLQLWASMHRRLWAAGGALLGGAALAIAAVASRSDRPPSARSPFDLEIERLERRLRRAW